MILDFDQEIISQRRNKLRILLNKPNQKQQFCQHQYQIIKQVLEPPKRIFSYSRSIRHFQEIMSKTGSISVNEKAKTLFIKQNKTINQKQRSDTIKDTNCKSIQTDELIMEEQGYKIDQTQRFIQESPYIRKRKFANNINLKDSKQLYKKRAIEQSISLTPQTGRNINQSQFQNEILQQKVELMLPLYDRSTHFLSKKKHLKIKLDKLDKLDAIFATATNRF
ncbi:unnamed protein product [Paramecium sonneborni]|uniref:Uncharacterized protein n=1 Tax=Paramecium sonneborni TaxID=65129 RepID=A0A8S1R8N6_9CILI|nr:unnamed protein product [Paramecium sonneborni]